MTHTCARTYNGRARRDPYTGPVTLPPPPSHQDISRLAYSYWEERMRNDQPGSAEDDWFRAEKHLAK